jgi:nucleoid DNA-binding protein
MHRVSQKGVDFPLAGEYQKRENILSMKLRKRNKIKRSDLAERLRERFQLSKAQARKVVQLFVREISNALEKKGRVEIRTLGTLWVAEYKPRSAFNPKTKKRIVLPFRRLVRYRKSSVLNPNPYRMKEK